MPHTGGTLSTSHTGEHIKHILASSILTNRNNILTKKTKCTRSKNVHLYHHQGFIERGWHWDKEDIVRKNVRDQRMYVQKHKRIFSQRRQNAQDQRMYEHQEICTLVPPSGFHRERGGHWDLKKTLSEKMYKIKECTYITNMYTCTTIREILHS